MITDVEYLQLVSEAYDLSDYKTKKNVLLCNEAKKVVNIENIVGRLYNHIKNNITAIDFGTIPKSKGIFSHVENYNDIIDCINSIHELVQEYDEDTRIIDEISTAIDNIQKRERYFSKAFVLNIELPMMIYNMTVLAVISSVSLMISSSIEYIKNGHDSFSVALDKVGYSKTRDHMLYQYIVQFNHTCADRSLDKTINECIKNNVVAVKEFTEEKYLSEGIVKDVVKAGMDIGITGAAAKGVKYALAHAPLPLKVIAIIIAAGIAIIKLIDFLRIVAYYWMHSRMRLSDWFAIQSDYLRINAENLKYRDDDRGDDHKKAVYQSQMKWVERFKTLSNIIAVKDAKAKKEASDDNDDYSRKRRYDDDDDNNSDNDGGLF